MERIARGAQVTDSLLIVRVHQPIVDWLGIEPKLLARHVLMGGCAVEIAGIVQSLLGSPVLALVTISMAISLSLMGYLIIFTGSTIGQRLIYLGFLLAFGPSNVRQIAHGDFMCFFSLGYFASMTTACYFCCCRKPPPRRRTVPLGKFAPSAT